MQEQFSFQDLPPILCGDGENYREKYFALYKIYKSSPYIVGDNLKHYDVGIINEFGKSSFLGFQSSAATMHGQLEPDDYFSKSDLEQVLILDNNTITYWLEKYNYYYKFVRSNDADDILTFGKYEGKTVQNIVDADFDYFQFCLREVDRFFCKGKYLIDLSNAGLIFDKETIDGYAKKEIERRSYDHFMQVWEDVMDASAPSSFSSNNDDYEDNYFENPSINQHYDDNLDMNQQGEDYWESQGLW